MHRPRLRSDVVKRLRQEQRGSISIVAAAGLIVVLAVSALALDLGSIHVQRRRYQGAVDLAAMAASTDLAHAEAAVSATLRANGIVLAGPNDLNVELGRYTADASLSPSLRFQPGNKPANAVRVTMMAPSKTFFARYFTNQLFIVKVSAVAFCDNLAAFSIGSRLLGVSGGTANAFLGSLLGSDVDLSVMDYDALSKFDVNLLTFLDALAAKLNITAGTYNDVLRAEATTGDVLSALVRVADGSADARSASALTRLMASGAGSASIDLSTLVSAGPLGGLSVGSQPAGIVATVNALQIIGGAAAIANGSRQATLDLTAAVPGLISLKADIAVGEPIQHSAYSAVGDVGATVRTAQTRIRVVAQIGGTGLLAGATIRLPIYLDVASAEARLSAITCGSQGTGSVDVAVTPGVAQAWIGDGPSDLTNFGNGLAIQSAKMVDTALAKIYGKAEVDAGSSRATTLTFGPSDIGNGTIKQANADGLTQGVVTSLLKNLTLNVQVAGVGIGLGSQLNSLVLSRLNSVAGPLDTVVVGLLMSLGVHVGQADVLVDGIRCRGNGILSG